MIFFVLFCLWFGQVVGSHQFHLSIAGDGSSDYFLDWVSSSKSASSSRIRYGYTAENLAFEADGVFIGEVEEEGKQQVYCFSTRLSSLEPNRQVFYSLVEDAQEETFTFVARSPQENLRWAVFGDMGASLLGGPSAVSLQGLTKALIEDKAYDGVLNLGDIAYELTQANGKDYMEGLAPVMARVPMHIITGNHEYDNAGAPFYTLRNFQRRFAGQLKGVGQASGSNSNEYFSFDSGLIHFVFIQTEFYGKNKEVQAFGNDTATMASDAQEHLEWLEADLEKVDRKKTPFIVMAGHRTPFKTPKGLDKKDNRFGKEIVPLMDKYQVDLYLCGHTHVYLVLKESQWNGFRIPPVIVSGSPGNADVVDTIADLKLGHFEIETSAEKYGYGYLEATSKGLNWEWGSAATSNGANPSPADWKKESEFFIERRF